MVEFRDTPPRPIPSRSTDELLEDLCLELRAVGVREGRPSADEHVAEVLAIAAELQARGASIGDRLDRLTQETGWLMPELFDDCRRALDRAPYVTDLDGVRRRLRCRWCRVTEHPEDDARYLACDECLQKMVDSFDSLVPIAGTVLFRTYNPEWRCPHADADTVVLVVDASEEGIHSAGGCRRCLEDVLRQRRAAADRRD